MSGVPVEIFDRQSVQDIQATLLEELAIVRVVETERIWGPIRRELTQRRVNEGVALHELPQHWHWDWESKAPRLKVLAYQCIGIEYAGDMQGMMMIDKAGHTTRSETDKNMPLIYIDYIESAPWNVKELVDEPRYGGVGIRLIEAAIRISLEEGFHGRIGLHALSQAERFYCNACGMNDFGLDDGAQKPPLFRAWSILGPKFLERRTTMIKEMNTDRKWLHKMMSKEDNAIISVGGLMLKLDNDRNNNCGVNCQSEPINAFSKLIQMNRRKRNLNVEEFATQADVDVEEIYAIEQGNYSDIEPRTIHQLAKTLGYDVSKLMMLSGQAIPKDGILKEAAVRFAARSGCNATELSDEERKALEEFVRWLV